ncbi:SGNH/GDSL hydrolase family protein [Nonomuraea typhae]|uniref:SGNH/GDSL hydrolase family protein n=1 Tax=Nonomuraea typhae TaxID=2603600 RepID=UPI0012F7334B|nr:SGNH/GDSL hydrolase family protein [Nonomuraea typhae]
MHTRNLSAVLAVAGMAVLAGCGGASTAEPAPAGSGVRLLWMGDSIAGAQAPALEAAMKAGGAAFKDITSDGGGNVVSGGHEVTTMAAKDTWKALKENLASFRPTVVAYQVTTYDWGTAQQQLSAYRKLAKTVRDSGARLVLVSAPPYKIDAFYKPHERAIESAPAMAAKAAEAGQARYLDAAQLWGRDYAAGQAQRAKDGIHSCQQGSAAFAAWFGKQLGTLVAYTPAEPGAWATGAWTGDERFAKLGCG